MIFFWHISSGMYNAIIMPGVNFQEAITMLKYIIILLFLFLAGTGTAFAQWFEAEGSAQIRNGDTPAARQEAIDDAMRQVMLESGSFITSSQNVRDGVISDDSFNIAASGNIRQYILLSEKKDGSFFKVKIRVFVDTVQNQCLGAAWKKTVMPVLFTYDSEQFQESMHGLQGINAEITKVVTRTISGFGGVISRSFYDKNLGIDPLRHAPDSKRLDTTLRQLARNFDTEYILTGVIRDLSRSRPDDGWLNRTFGDDIRQFGVSFYLFDGLTGELISGSDYRGAAEWKADYGRSGVQSREFWDSPYGQEVRKVLEKGTREAAQIVACRRPLARILKVDAATGSVLVNLGRQNNLKQGTRFFIDHRGMFTDKDGNLRFTSDRAKTPLKTVEVYDSAALLVPIGTANGNVQIDDIAQIE